MLSGFREEIFRVGFVVDKGLLGFDEILFLQGFDVAREVSVGGVEQLLEGRKIEGVVYGQRRHDAQPDATFESLV